MEILMTGLDYGLAPVELREQLSFTKARMGELVRSISAIKEISGCVLISTCNRTELYLSGGTGFDPGVLLCTAAGLEYEPFASAFITREDADAVRHLAEVACGLRSQIWGEDQIISQVKESIAIARENGGPDPILEKLFQSAVSCGKAVKTKVGLTGVPTSAADIAVETLNRLMGGLHGKNALVIGNGEMGRLTARLLREAGCRVTITLRTYQRSETVVPAGCEVIQYEERFRAVPDMDVLVSATTSPHFTITLNELKELERIPQNMIDLSIPRDIEPEVGNLPGVTLLSLDSLGTAKRDIPPQAEEIIESHIEGFYQWRNFRDSIPAFEKVKEAIVERILGHGIVDSNMDVSEIVELAVNRSVELMAGGLKDCVTYERFDRCGDKIRANTTKFDKFS